MTDDDQKDCSRSSPGLTVGRVADDTVTDFDTANSGTPTAGRGVRTGDELLWFTDGVNAEVFRGRPATTTRSGPATTSRPTSTSASMARRTPRGWVRCSRDTLAVVDDSSETIYEPDKSGALLKIIDTSSAGMGAAAGIAVAPA